MFPDSPLSEIKHLLANFAHVDLQETNAKASLMSRRDMKFILHPNKLTELVNACKPHFALLNTNPTGISQYSTHYFDTPQFALYLAHHAGKLNRYKIRIRQYMDTGQSFLELKSKNNKRETIKQRVLINDTENDPLQYLEGLHPTPFSLHTKGNLIPTLQVRYNRITLVSLNGDERMTIDTELSYRDENQFVQLPGYIVVEWKHMAGMASAVNPTLRTLAPNYSAMSKYCLGVTLLKPNVKSNRFKPFLRKINPKFIS